MSAEDIANGYFWGRVYADALAGGIGLLAIAIGMCVVMFLQKRGVQK